MDTLKIVFVDDDPDDRDFIKQCLKKGGIEDYKILDSGYALMHYLKNLKEGELPEIIVLDLNMPSLNGYEILRMVKTIPRYQKIPVFLLTQSERIPIVVQSIRDGAAGYYHKTNNIEEYNRIIQELYHIATE